MFKPRIKSTLTAIIAVLAFGALTTSASAALPEFAVKPGFKITEAKYEGTLPETDWETSNRNTFSCTDKEVTEGSFLGYFLNSKTVTGKLVFTGCYCKSKGAKVGEIATVELEGALVYISKTSKTVGINFKPKTGNYLTKFGDCSGEVTGSIIIPISGPLNKFARAFSVSALHQSHGEQEISHYENELGQLVSSSLRTTWPGGITSVPLGWSFPYSEGFTISTNKELELKA